jgi:hypothetical protein
MTIKIHANDKEIQKTLIEITAQADSPKYMRNPQERKNPWIWYLHQTQR